MILIFVIFVSSSLAKGDKTGLLAPKPTPNGECLDTLEYCKIILIR